MAAFALAACTGCLESTPSHSTASAARRVRDMEEVDWLVDTLIGGEPDDTTLLLPGIIDFQNGLLLVYD